MIYILFILSLGVVAYLGNYFFISGRNNQLGNDFSSKEDLFETRKILLVGSIGIENLVVRGRVE